MLKVLLVARADLCCVGLGCFCVLASLSTFVVALFGTALAEG
jgi:hypothetical protein